MIKCECGHYMKRNLVRDAGYIEYVLNIESRNNLIDKI